MSKFPELDNWDPMEEDYRNPQFNSYNEMADSTLYDLSSLYVRNVPSDFADETFLSMMSDQGRKVKRHKLMPPKPNSSTTVGLVTFMNETDAQDALNSFHKKPPYRFNIQFANKKIKEVKNFLNPWWNLECEEAYRLKRKICKRFHHKPTSSNGEECRKVCSYFRAVRRRSQFECSNPTEETPQDSNANFVSNSSFQQTKKPLGRGIGIQKDVASLSNLKIVVEGEKRTTFRNSPEKASHFKSPVNKQKPQLLSYPFPPCLFCKKPASKVCSTCQQSYCSIECQDKDWPKHQAVCKPLARLSRDSSQHRSESYKGADSSYMSEGSSDAEKSSDLSHRLNRVRLNSSRTTANSKAEPSFDKIISASNVSSSREASNFKKAVTISDLKEIPLPPEGKVRVISIDSPSCFWVQLKEAENILSEIEKFTSSANLKKTSCSVDDICCVNHKSKYCRVQILKVMPSNSLVRFIDIGGTSSFPLNQIYDLPEGLKKYPPQAICCNLVDSSKDKIVQWSEEETSAFKSIALNKIYNNHVHGCSNGVNDVSLFDKEGVSVFSMISLLHLQGPDQDSSYKCSEIPSIWTSLKKNKEITIVPVEFDNEKFYGMIAEHDEASETFKALEDRLINPNTEDISICCEEGDVAVGFSPKFNQFFRCLVLKRMKNSFLVHYIDFGNQEEITRLCALPPDIFPKKTFVVCCKRPSSISPTEFKKLFAAASAGTVKSANSNYVELEFFCSSKTVVLNCYPWFHDLVPYGLKASNSLDAPAKQVSVPKKIMKSAIENKKVFPEKKYEVKVVFMKTSSEVFVQLVADEGEILTLCKNLNQFCNSSDNDNKKYVPEIDEVVACKFSADRNWYRGQILGKSEKGFRVFFIDFGNEDIVSEVDIRPLSEKFVCSKLCLSVSLCGIKNEEISPDLLEKLFNELWVMEIIACNKDSVQVVLSQGQKPLVDFVKKNNLLSVLTIQKLPSEEPVDIQISHVDSKNLYVWKQMDMQKIETLANKLNLAEKKAISSKALLNHVYCGLFSDGLWYRVSIEKELASNKYLANFIDFGNKDEIEIKDLRELPKEFLVYPVFSIPVTALNFDPTTLQAQKIYSVKVYGEKMGVQEIEFCTPELVKQCLPKVSTLKKLNLSVGEKVEIVLCHIEGDIFYWHLKSARKEIESLESKLLEAAGFDEILCMPEIGEILCAKFSDGIWYRGAVTEICSAKSCKICFVDYGNTEEISLQDMKILPSSLASFPIFSIPIKLKNVGAIEEVEFPVQILDKKENIYIAERVNSTDDLIKISPQVLPQTEVNINVSFKEGSKYFIQKLCDLEALAKMTSDLLACDLQAISSTPQIGGIFCVKYQDGGLYRGLVKSKYSKDSYSVYFMDFGNTDETKISDMFVLPSEHATHPMFCVQVELDKAALCNPLELDHQYVVKYIGKMNSESQMIRICSPTTPILCSSLKKLSLENSGEVYFVSFDNDCHFVRKSSDLEEYKRMLSSLDNLNCNKIVHIPVVNEVLLVKCEDKKIYRVSVAECNEALGLYKVFLIDSGATKNVSANDLFYMPPKICSFPDFNIKVKVSSTSPFVKLGNTYNVCVIGTNDIGVPIVTVVKHFLFKDLECKWLPIHEPTEVIFYHKECDTLYLQDFGSIQSSLIEIQTEVNGCASSKALAYNPVEGELLSVKSADDGAWYRGCVTQVLPSDKFKIRFIDYGNSEVVLRENLRPFSEVLMKYPSQAIAVKLESPKMDIVFQELFTVIALSKPSNGIQTVKLQIDNSSKLDAIPSSEDSMSTSRFYLRNCKYVPLPSGKQLILIYHVEEKGRVYCAPWDENSIAMNYSLMNDITEYCRALGVERFNGESQPEIGELVLARYGEGEWYRAVVVSKSPPHYDVMFVDYGNSTHVHEDYLRKMDEKFMQLEIQAHECKLIGFSVTVGKEAAVLEELKQFEMSPREAVLKENGENKTLTVPSITDLLIQKRLAVCQD